MKTSAGLMLILLAPMANGADLFSLMHVDQSFYTKLTYLYLGTAHLDDDASDEWNAPFDLTYVGGLSQQDKRNKQWELSLSGTLLSQRTIEGQRFTGFGDVIPSVTRIFCNDPQTFFSVRGGASLPTGSDGITTESVDGFVHARSQWGPLTERAEVNVMVTRIDRGLAPDEGRAVLSGSIGFRLDRGWIQVGSDITGRAQSGVGPRIGASVYLAHRFDLRSHLYATVEKGTSTEFDGEYYEVGVLIPLTL